MAGKRAPSCHLWFDDRKKGDIIMHDVLVPEAGVTPCTYYCCMQWNGGQNGGGYCGIQEHPEGQCFIFSIWDPTTTNEAIEPAFRHPGTKTQKFGGEGTGLKSMNFTVGWKPDQWYTLVSKRWDVGEHTHFGFWVRDHVLDKWCHLVTMDFPVPDIHFHTPTVCFIEDWTGNGEKSRRVHFRNGYKHIGEGSWLPFKNASFNVVKEEACKLYNDNYNGGIDSDCFFMQTGHGTTPQPVLDTDRKFCCSTAAETSPRNAPVTFALQEVTSAKVTWYIPESCTPQFSFSVLVDGKEIGSGIDSETRSCDISPSLTSEVKVILVDILGRQSSQSASVDDFNDCCQETNE